MACDEITDGLGGGGGQGIAAVKHVTTDVGQLSAAPDILIRIIHGHFLEITAQGGVGWGGERLGYMLLTLAV